MTQTSEFSGNGNTVSGYRNADCCFFCKEIYKKTMAGGVLSRDMCRVTECITSAKAVCDDFKPRRIFK